MLGRSDIRPAHADRKANSSSFSSHWRRRLDARLDLLAHCDCLMLEAPVGYGKRSIVERWRLLLLSDGQAVHSLRLGEVSNINSLIADLAIALTTGAPLTSVLERRPPLTEATADPDRKTIFILEGLHTLDKHASARLLDLLCDLPPNVGAVITTRHAAPSEAARLIAGGRLWRLSRAELAMKQTEARDWLSGQASLSLSPQGISRVLQIAGGWPAAIESAALWLQSRPKADEAAKSLTGIWPTLSDWIDAAIWSALPPEEKQFLADLSILSEIPIDDELVPKLTERGDALQLLQDLDMRTPFFVAADRGLKFRPFAAAFIADAAVPLDRNRLRRLHRKAGRLLADRHDGRAISHFIASGDAVEARERAGEMLTEVAALGRAPLVLDWLRHLPPDLLADDGKRALTLTQLGAIDQVVAWLERTELCARRLTTEEIEERLVVRAALAAWRDDPDGAASILSSRSTSDAISPPFAAAERNLRRWVDRQFGKTDTFAAFQPPIPDFRQADHQVDAYCSAALCDGEAFLDIGQAQAAERVLHRARDAALRRVGDHAWPVLHLTAALAAALCQGGRRSEAGALTAQWPQLDTDALRPSALWLGHLAVARTAAEDGRAAEACASLDHVLEIAEQRGLHRVRALSIAETGRIATVMGRPAAALDAARRLKAIVSEAAELRPVLRAHVRLAAFLGLARIHIGQKCWTEADSCLAEAQSLALPLGRSYDMAEISLLRRVSPLGVGESAEGHVDRIAAADREILRDGVMRLAMTAVDQRRRPAPLGSRKSHQPAATLTAREGMVLELMARGTSLRLIAEALGVSRETVKWHQKNIYAKLEISDRHQVVARARELGLV